MSKASAKYSKKRKSQKKGVKKLSWHFWFLHAITGLALLLGYSIGESNHHEFKSAAILGGLIYFSPLLMCVVKGAIPVELMVKFYKKT